VKTKASKPHKKSQMAAELTDFTASFADSLSTSSDEVKAETTGTKIKTNYSFLNT